MYFLICGKIDVKGKMTRADKKKQGGEELHLPTVATHLVM